MKTKTGTQQEVQSSEQKQRVSILPKGPHQDKTLLWLKKQDHLNSVDGLFWCDQNVRLVVGRPGFDFPVESD